MEDKQFVLKHEPDSAIRQKLFADGNYSALSFSEREAIYWIAVMRTDPPKFANDIVKTFLNQFPEVNGGAARSLMLDLTRQDPLPMLFPETRLKKAADLQAKYLQGRDKLVHTGPRGKSFQQRMSEVGIKDCAGENLFEGKADALVSLLLLLIDNGVPDFGHRKTLLNPSFSSIGISMLEEGGGRMIMVQDFSCN